MSKEIHRKVYSYNVHLSTADYFMSLSEKEGKSEHFNSIGIVVFSAFALEAFMNHVGNQLFSTWGKHLKKSLNPESKLALISEKIGLDVNYGNPPYQSFRALFRIRNAMAHSETESLTPEQTKHYIEVGGQSWPAAEWEKFCTFERATVLLLHTKEIISLIEEKSGIEKIPRFILSEFVEI